MNVHIYRGADEKRIDYVKKKTWQTSEVWRKYLWRSGRPLGFTMVSRDRSPGIECGGILSENRKSSIECLFWLRGIRESSKVGSLNVFLSGKFILDAIESFPGCYLNVPDFVFSSGGFNSIFVWTQWCGHYLKICIFVYVAFYCPFCK